jgi:hypothetical protein
MDKAATLWLQRRCYIQASGARVRARGIVCSAVAAGGTDGEVARYFRGLAVDVAPR